ncbi:MAG TPA: hypothetical protein VM122_02465 [Usitatibacter sp.]|nr:hypothetical protein [Usitatibacter sp.]
MNMGDPSEPVRPALPPVAGAKIELLRCVEATGSCGSSLLAEELLDARTLRELAMRAREIAYQLQEMHGDRMANRFWNDAKAILLVWRGQSEGER